MKHRYRRCRRDDKADRIGVQAGRVVRIGVGRGERSRVVPLPDP